MTWLEPVAMYCGNNSGVCIAVVQCATWEKSTLK